jgi:hypothetical protein
MKKFSRRTVIKMVAGLFAFVPAVRSLLEITDAKAINCSGLMSPTGYVPCSDDNYMICDEFVRWDCVWLVDDIYLVAVCNCFDMFTGQRCTQQKLNPRLDSSGNQIPC